MKPGQGKVIWITGLSGVGKSSIAKKIFEILCQKEIWTLLLDGDEVRSAIADPSCGHDRGSRIINGYRISRFSKLFAEQGATVITATMSMFHEIHEWNRHNLPRYFEVYIKADMKALKSLGLVMSVYRLNTAAAWGPASIRKFFVL